MLSDGSRPATVGGFRVSEEGHQQSLWCRGTQKVRDLHAHAAHAAHGPFKHVKGRKDRCSAGGCLMKDLAGHTRPFCRGVVDINELGLAAI